MKSIIVGDWQWILYEEALAKGFKYRQIEVIPFKTSKYFNSFLKKIQKKLRCGILITKLNNDLLSLCEEKKPNFIFFQRPELILPNTLSRIKCLMPKVVLISYHNDNPYIQNFKGFKYSHYFNCLPYFDINYVYRPSNVNQAKKIGAKNVKVLLPYYIKGVHNKAITEEKKYDVVFIGHYENDNRVDFCNYLLDQGINLKIFGTGWPNKIEKKIGENIVPLRGDLYVKTLQEAKIALVFYSTLNEDVYTRRNFEIPATGTFMLTPQSEELDKIFIPNKHCVYYSHKEDLLKKINFYLQHENERETIAKTGCELCRKKFSNFSISQKILNDIEEYENSRSY
ncbi:MAG: glycosyltransferase family 1 protein [Bacteroidetes bacterium]|nr:glycosyltransferase family 1 protein [Bacteroidota bacterium]